jgi:hypothetical protein
VSAKKVMGENGTIAGHDNTIPIGRIKSLITFLWVDDMRHHYVLEKKKTIRN